jgi:hypothetical protein
VRFHKRRCEKLKFYIRKKKIYFINTGRRVTLHFSGMHLLHKLKYASMFSLCLRRYTAANYANYGQSKFVQTATPLALFGRWPVRISAGISTILTDVFLGPSSQIRGEYPRPGPLPSVLFPAHYSPLLSFDARPVDLYSEILMASLNKPQIKCN